ncbi:hypothetical protein CHS0354_031947 [Potamilus streckersoni]|uniref:Uncharacterized protein n=1 Tax=Potamilus streckersoni TaxID=2493646 RepID=A0AAE0S3P3_9BIVA|nr:hypothetical protein CHS0354_031947 [Potamilus streckersoni]
MVSPQNITIIEILATNPEIIGGLLMPNTVTFNFSRETLLAAHIAFLYSDKSFDRLFGSSSDVLLSKRSLGKLDSLRSINLFGVNSEKACLDESTVPSLWDQHIRGLIPMTKSCLVSPAI